MSEANQAAVAVSGEEHYDVFDAVEMATMKRLYSEASNLLELLADDPEAHIRWGCERAQIEDTLEEAAKILWPNK